MFRINEFLELKKVLIGSIPGFNPCSSRQSVTPLPLFGRYFRVFPYLYRTMRFLLFIGMGSFLGGISRYLFAQFVQQKFLSAFPYGTLAVNILGCFIIGLVFGASEKTDLSVEWRLFLATGFCGGFTTFSAFSNETLGLLRDGQFWSASVYILASVAMGLLGTFAGFSVFKLF